MTAEIYIGTSGWHYAHWNGTFYPHDVTGYNELRYLSERFNTVENNASFYRIAGEATYATWDRMTPSSFVFSMKLNKLITHIHRLEVNAVVQERVQYILASTQILKHKLGAIVIQLPPNFKLDIEKLETFLAFFTAQIQQHTFHFDVAIEFRNTQWFIGEVYTILQKYNVALVAGQSSRYPLERRLTADIAYIRMHGPQKLFASTYTKEELETWKTYILSIAPHTRRIYMYFNNDFNCYALQNAQELKELLRL